ncbi:MAG: isocitrate/isopropylmalate dehydrogenase family protein [Bacillota bacterium]
MAHSATIIYGDGSGPEVITAARKIIDATGVKIDWEEAEAGERLIEEQGTNLPILTIASLYTTKVALKGPLATPIGEGNASVNVALRKAFDLYANVRPVKNLPGVKTRYDNVDLVIIRENTEGLYAGMERMVDDNTAQTIKQFTTKGCERICRYAFDFAVKNGRKKVTAVHKANIMKMTDGMFLRIARKVAEEYPDIEFNDSIVDAMCMRLVMYPEQYDVLLCPNFYGDILSDLAAGLVGGLGLAASGNIGSSCAIFEPVHGSAPDIAGQNKVNPTAAILSGAKMLTHLGEVAAAKKIEAAVLSVLEKGEVVTVDLGGSATTTEFADAVIGEMK